MASERETSPFLCKSGLQDFRAILKTRRLAHATPRQAATSKTSQGPKTPHRLQHHDSRLRPIIPSTPPPAQSRPRQRPNIDASSAAPVKLWRPQPSSATPPASVQEIQPIKPGVQQRKEMNHQRRKASTITEGQEPEGPPNPDPGETARHPIHLLSEGIKF